MSNTSKDILVAELIRKRAELTGALQRNQTELAKIMGEIGTIDSALFMFAPEVRVDKIVGKELPAMHLAGRGEMTLIVLDILRQAHEGIQTDALNLMVMKARNLNVNDPKLVRMMYQRLHSCLRNHRNQKRVRSRKGPDGKATLWEIATI